MTEQIENKLSVADQRTATNLLQTASRLYQLTLRSNVQKHIAVDYLKSRNIQGETAKRFQIGYVPKQWDLAKQYFNSLNMTNNTRSSLVELGILIQNDNNHYYDRFRERIMFPIRNVQGETISFAGRTLSCNKEEAKYINGIDSPLFHKKKELYGLYEALDNNKQLPSIIVVEGYFDVIKLSQAGITNVVAVMGTALTREHLDQLTNYTDHIIFCFDGDKAGHNAAIKTAETCITHQSKNKTYHFVTLPDDHDPDSYVSTYSALAFEDLCEKKKKIETYLTDHVMQTNIFDVKRINHASQYLSSIKNEVLKEKFAHELSKNIEIPAALINVFLNIDIIPTKILREFTQ